MTQNAFEKAAGGDGSTVDPQVNAPDTSAKPTITLPPEVAELIGEGKKYATLEAALKSIPHAQAHIQRLEAETADMRARKVDVEEVLANMSKGSSHEATTTSIDENTVADRVLAKLSAKEQEETKKKNLEKVNTTLIQKVGSVDAAALLIVEKANQLGLHPDDLRRIAEKSPSAFLAYFNETTSTKTEDKSPMPKGSMNTQAISNDSTRVEQGTYAWHQAQRRSQGDRWYFSEAATKARTKDLDRLGRDKFFGK